MEFRAGPSHEETHWVRVGIAALNLRVVRTIIVSWLATAPIAAVFSMVIYAGLRALFL